MVQPFLKWAGGKRWLTNNSNFTKPTTFRRYFEPFLGSGAVFFHLKPASALLSDLNPSLINLYIQMRDKPEDLQALLAKHHEKHSKDYYYLVRDQQIDRGLAAASNFLYLNRSCWNGLFRVNLSGKFNVPIGTKDKIIMDTDNFTETAKVLKNADIQCCDFEDSINQAEENDFLFVDPPYTVKHNLNGFLKYNEDIFKWSDQIRLRDSLVKAKERGATIVVTNADHQSVRDLYAADFSYSSLERHSVLAGSSNFRRQTTEAFFTCGIPSSFDGESLLIGNSVLASGNKATT